MPPTSFEFPSFGGWRMSSDPQEVGPTAAIDISNMVLEPETGRLKTRPGTGALVTATGTGVFGALVPHHSSTLGTYLVDGHDGGGPKMFAYLANTLTTSLAHASGLGVAGYANFGTPAATRTYMAMGPTTPAIRFDGTSLTTIAAIANWSAMAVQQSDNRLVVGNHASDPSRVAFSDPGAPETFGVNNFVTLSPGDGESIAALVSYQNFVFAFKQTKFFVFYGTDTDGTGPPIFNYRAVDVGIGLADQYGFAPNFSQVAVAPEGVYFVGRDGIYLTTGGPPVLVVDLLPMIRGLSLPYFTGTATWTQPFALARYDGKLYISHLNQTLVYDVGSKTLSVFPLSITSYMSYRGAGLRPDLAFISPTVNTQVRFFSDLATTDSGVAIVGRYRTGFWDPGRPGAESWVREVLFDGTGAITVKQATNDAIALGSGLAVTLGTAPAVAQGRDRRGMRGRNFSWEFSGTGPWSISRAEPIVWSQRAPGLRS